MGYSKDVLGICQSCKDSNKVMNIVVTVVMLMLLASLIFFLKKRFYKKYKKQFRGLKASCKILFVSYQIIAVLPR